MIVLFFNTTNHSIKHPHLPPSTLTPKASSLNPERKKKKISTYHKATASHSPATVTNPFITCA